MRELSLHILDLARNSIEAGATELTLEVAEHPAEDQLVVVVRDNGRGMDQETLVRATDAFFTSRTTRRQGLGLALFQAMVERSEGTLALDSAPGRGTTVRARVRLSHLDRPPLGDMGGVAQTLACEADRVRLRYRHEAPAGVFELDTADLQRELGEVPVTNPAVLHWIGEHVRQGLREVGSTA
jgi:anti-sigma regulatory factor (Ser/Thr protein kinase)